MRTTFPCEGCGAPVRRHYRSDWRQTGYCKKCLNAMGQPYKHRQPRPRFICNICRRERPVPPGVDPRYARICADCQARRATIDEYDVEALPRCEIRFHPMYIRGVIR